MFVRFSPLHRLFTTRIFAEKSTENQQSRENPQLHQFTPPAAVKCEKKYIPIRPEVVPLVSKTNSVILLSLFCCLSTLYRLVFIFSMAQRTSAAQCQAGRNSTNPWKSEKLLEMCNKIACFLGVGSSALLRAAVSSLVLSVEACCGWCMVYRW